jgi:hypothetical protein
MGASLYAGRLDTTTTTTSPYADMIGEDQWQQVEQLFRQEYCTALGLPSESPLYTRYNNNNDDCSICHID